MSSIVQITALRKQYDGHEVVRGIDLNVAAGRGGACWCDPR
jgi:ABC-type Fe3+/spermidine/putrescine transport system ATPase subunit